MDNPMGKGSNAISNRKLIREDLDRRFDSLIKKKKDFTFTVYRDKHEYYIHFLIPSESERDNTYDVVIHFTEREENFKNDNFLNRYTLNFFSNSPSFTYTYAYVFNEYDILIKFLAKKYDKIVLSNNPITRNPGEVVNYEKSIYFALKYISIHKDLMNKMYLNRVSKTLHIDKLRKIIRTDEEISLEIKKENNRLSREKKKESNEKPKDKKLSGTITPISKSINRIIGSPSTTGKANRITKTTAVKSTSKKKR